MSFLGSVFPADPAYAGVITTEAVKIGERPARALNDRAVDAIEREAQAAASI